MAGTKTEVTVGGRTLSLTNLDKVLYPACGFTKAQVIDYHTRIAEVYLRHLRARPVTLKRYPNGVEGEFFYEKNCPSHAPGWMRTVTIRGETETTYCLLDEPAALVWTANLAALELHTTLGKGDAIDVPTMVVFDLDPGDGAGIADCAAVAMRIRSMCDKLGLELFVKTSGSKGLHLGLPLNTPAAYEDTAGFAKAIAGLLAKHNPDAVTDNMRKDLRTNKVFIDWSQNRSRKTTVTAYSLRAKAEPAVSTPITWDETDDLAAGGDAEAVSFVTADVLERVTEVGDLWAPVTELEQQLPA